jgi:hypothetical protein
MRRAALMRDFSDEEKLKKVKKDVDELIQSYRWHDREEMKNDTPDKRPIKIASPKINTVKLKRAGKRNDSEMKKNCFMQRVCELATLKPCNSACKRNCMQKVSFMCFYLIIYKFYDNIFHLKGNFKLNDIHRSRVDFWGEENEPAPNCRERKLKLEKISSASINVLSGSELMNLFLND